MDRRALICDIETVAIADAAQYLEPVEAPANYKDHAKIAAYEVEAAAKQLDRCALDPDLCRIVALGWMLEDEDRPVTVIAKDESQERFALMQFWRSVVDRQFVTFHGFAFDLPVLMRRSLYLGIEHPVLNLDKYRSPHLDLYQRLTFNGVLPAHSLRFYCARFGILVDDLATGKDIAALVTTGDWNGVQGHCHADVLATRALAKRLGYLRGVEQVTVAS